MQEIHDWLENQERMLDGKRLWRLVWSEDMVEKRKGEFNDFCGPIFVRSYTGVREVRKYNYIHNRWVLEKFVPGANAEVESDGGTYEPFFTFETSKGEFILPTLKVVQFIISFARNPIKTTPSERRDMLEKSEDQEVNEVLGLIDETIRSPIGSLLSTHEAVSLYVPTPQETVKLNKMIKRGF